jgi:hypothetical protein
VPNAAVTLLAGAVAALAFLAVAAVTDGGDLLALAKRLRGRACWRLNKAQA